MLNFVICDDNLNIINKFSKILEKIFKSNNYDGKVAYLATNGDDLLNYLDTNPVDVIFLDINLKSNKTGLEIASLIRKKNQKVYLIFTTGHLEYAMLAYKYKTFDYLPKPVTQERLEETISRLFQDINSKPKKYIKIDNKNTLLDEDEILFIKRDGMKLVFETKNKNFDTYSSFNKIKNNLPNNFVRCHKSFVVNINNITNLDPVGNIIYFNNNLTCEIGPKYKENLMEVVKENGNF